MKFFAQFVESSDESRIPCGKIDQVFGPYQDDEALQRDMTEVSRRRRTTKAWLVFEGVIVTPRPHRLAKPPELRREPGNYANFKQQNDEYVCNDCGEKAVSREVVSQTEESSREMGVVRTSFPVCLNCDKTQEQATRPVVLRNVPDGTAR